MTQQVAALTAGWEHDVPVQDTLARRFVFAGADRIAEMARRTAAAAAVAPELPAMLISSDDGRPVHHRLGYLDLFRATMWHHPPR